MDRSAAAHHPLAVPRGSAAARGPGLGGSHRRPSDLRTTLRGPRGRLCLAAASVVLLLVVTTIVLLPRHPPETVVRDFYAALAARDAGAARALVLPGAVYGPDATLLTDATLRDPGYTPPANARTTRLPPPTAYLFGKGQEGAAVRVDFDLAGAARQAEVILARGGSYGESWVIVNPLARLGLTGGVRDGLLIFAGTPYPRSDRELVGFPGAYRVGLAEHPLFEADPVTVVTTGGANVELVPRIRADARQEIHRQIRAHLDACAGSPDVNPARCRFQTVPLSLSQLRAARVSRTITRYPTVLVEPSGAVDHPLVFRTDMPGEIQVVVRSSPTGPPVVDTKETVEVSGRVVLVGGAPVVEPAY